MFYSAQILAKKGPLGIVWLAAHMDGRLKRTEVFETSVPGSVDSIMNPEAPLALRLSGQLLLGVVRIYNKQTLYLYEDCSDTLNKLQHASKAGEPAQIGRSKAAPIAHITMPDDYQPFGMWNEDDFDLDLTNVDFSQLKSFELSGSKDKLLSADDGHAAFSSPLLYEAEQFDVTEEDMEEHLSMGSVEVMREAPELSAQRLFEGQEDVASPSISQGKQLPEDFPANDDLLSYEAGMPASPVPPSQSGIEAPGTEELLTGGMTPLQDEDLSVPEMELQSASHRKEKKPGHRTAAAAQQRYKDKRKRAQKDCDAEGRPQTMISTSIIRAQLRDCGPIIRPRPKPDKEYFLRQLPREVLSLTDPGIMGDHWMELPSLSSSLAPKLAELFSRSHNALQADHRIAQQGGGANLRMSEHDAVATPFAEPEHFDNVHDDFGDGGISIGLAAEPDVGDMLDSPAGDLPSLASPTSSWRPPSSRKRSEREPGYVSPIEDPDIDYQASAGSSELRQHGPKRLRLSGIGKGEPDFDELHAAGSRLEAARLFLDLLTLQSRKRVELRQEEPYGRIQVHQARRQ